MQEPTSRRLDSVRHLARPAAPSATAVAIAPDGSATAGWASRAVQASGLTTATERRSDVLLLHFDVQPVRVVEELLPGVADTIHSVLAGGAASFSVALAESPDEALRICRALAVRHALDRASSAVIAVSDAVHRTVIEPGHAGVAGRYAATPLGDGGRAWVQLLDGAAPPAADEPRRQRATITATSIGNVILDSTVHGNVVAGDYRDRRGREHG